MPRRKQVTGRFPAEKMRIENQSLRPEPGTSDDGSVVLLIFLLLLTLPAAYLVNTRVLSGFMDEEFHFSQVEILRTGIRKLQFQGSTWHRRSTWKCCCLGRIIWTLVLPRAKCANLPFSGL